MFNYTQIYHKLQLAFHTGNSDYQFPLLGYKSAYTCHNKLAKNHKQLSKGICKNETDPLNQYSYTLVIVKIRVNWFSGLPFLFLSLQKKIKLIRYNE